MRKMKRKNFSNVLTSLLLLVLLVTSMPQTVFAAGDYTITINNAINGHTYTAYQIFTGDFKDSSVDGQPGTLSNIEWGPGINDKGIGGLQTALQEAVGDSSAAKCAELIAAEGGFDVARALSQHIVESGYLGEIAASSEYVAREPITESYYTISGLDAGYYLVMDTTPNIDKDETGIVVGEDDGLSAYIVQVVGNVDVTPKSGVPTLEKKVMDVNDSTDETSDWQDSADYDIGDLVKFQLTVTLPNAYDIYMMYPLYFTDTLSKGLTLQEDSIRYYVNEVDEDHLINIDEVEDEDLYYFGLIDSDILDSDNGEHGFYIAFECLKAFDYGEGQKIVGGDKIIVTYEAELNSDAKIGAEGNPNTAKLSYLRNPEAYCDCDDEDGDGDTNGNMKPDDMGETPEDTVIVFTYELLIDKVTSDGTALDGAEFTLYKYDDEGSGNSAASETENDSHADYYEVTNARYKKVDGSSFTFTGLDDGKYLLAETTTPSGYNTIDPIEFTITAEHDTESSAPTLTALNITEISEGADLKADLNGTTEVTRKNNSEENLSSGQIFTAVVNNAGATLPTTGGIGTTIFYIVGGVCVVAASILLITKRIMSKKQYE